MARIFLSEPNPETRDLLTRCLHRLGHVLVDRDAEIVLVEPAQDGPGIIGLARRDSPGARVVVCSIIPHGSRALRAAGADAFLHKPVELADLRAALAPDHAVQVDGGSSASSSPSRPGASGRAK